MRSRMLYLRESVRNETSAIEGMPCSLLEFSTTTRYYEDEDVVNGAAGCLIGFVYVRDEGRWEVG
jgi:hypothetical protein